MDLSRRDFLKLSGAGMLALVLADLRLDEARALESPASFQGRSTFSGAQIYDTPSFSGKKLRLLGKDEVVDITAQTIGDGTYNRVWYRFKEGFTYSGWLQPVQTKLQVPANQLPRPRVLGEITVPFAETRRTASIIARRGQRAYYGATYWIVNVYKNNDEGTSWYEIYDKQGQQTLYINAAEMRIVPDEELAPLSPGVPDIMKSIQVDLSTQYVFAFEGDKLVFRSRCASGAGPKTPLGEFKTYHKGPSIHMTNEGDASTHTYNLPGVPWVSFFTGNGEAFHGTYWHNDFGTPRSHGCVNLPNAAAKFIYRWTNPTVPIDTDYLYLPKYGTPVTVFTSR